MYPHTTPPEEIAFKVVYTVMFVIVMGLFKYPTIIPLKGWEDWKQPVINVFYNTIEGVVTIPIIPQYCAEIRYCYVIAEFQNRMLLLELYEIIAKYV